MGLGNFMPLLAGGRIKLIAVGAPSRPAAVADVPTFAEAGLGAYPGRGWWGMAAPARTPRAIVDKLNAEFVKLFSEPKFLALLEKQLVIPAPSSPEEFGAFVREDRARAVDLIRLANTPPEDYKPARRSSARIRSVRHSGTAH